MNVIHCDISKNGDVVAGAFALNDQRPRTRLLSSLLEGTKAEIEFIILLIKEFRFYGPMEIHHDVQELITAYKSKWVLDQRQKINNLRATVQFVYHSKDPWQHVFCHDAARIRVGCVINPKELSRLVGTEKDVIESFVGLPNSRWALDTLKEYHENQIRIKKELDLDCLVHMKALFKINSLRSKENTNSLTL